jgi:hypothetical protein
MSTGSEKILQHAFVNTLGKKQHAMRYARRGAKQWWPRRAHFQVDTTRKEALQQRLWLSMHSLRTDFMGPVSGDLAP